MEDMVDRTRAAVVLFVDIDADQVVEPHDLTVLVQQALYQQHSNIQKDVRSFPELSVTRGGKELSVRVVDVEDLGMALGNGYVWTELTTKAWTNHGIYTEKQQKQIDKEKSWEDMGS